MIEHGKIWKMKKIIPALAVVIPLANNTSSRKYGLEENKNAAEKGRNMTTTTMRTMTKKFRGIDRNEMSQ